MLKVTTLTVGELQTNCYLAINPSTDQTLIIDPGDEADFITQTIIENKLTPIGIILTHGHFDHVLGTLELKLNFDIPVYLHKNDLKLYTSSNQSSHHWTKNKGLKVPPVDYYLSEDKKIPLGDETLTVIETPGHTPGSVCLYDSKKTLFTGDTIFKDGFGRTDFSYSKPLHLMKSLEKIFVLPDNIYIYPGHGEMTTIADEKRLQS